MEHLLNARKAPVLNGPLDGDRLLVIPGCTEYRHYNPDTEIVALYRYDERGVFIYVRSFRQARLIDDCCPLGEEFKP